MDNPKQRVLKHLAREFDLSPYDIRLELRKHMTPTGGRWRWPSEEDKDYKKARKLIKELSARKNNGRST